MAYYFIYAYPEKYGGFHGAYDYELVECADYKEACECGYDLAYQTVELYLHEDEIYSTEEFMEEFYTGEEWDEKYREEYWEIFDDLMQEQCSYEIYLLKDGITEKDYEDWLKENMPPKDFIKKYCRQLEETDV